MMQTQPIQSITISDLTRRAAVNRVTFYLHYQDKFDLLVSVARDTFTQMVNSKVSNWPAFQIGDIRLLAVATCEYFEGFLRGCAPTNKVFEPLIEAEVQRVLYDYIYCWLQQSGVADDGSQPIEMVAVVISASILNMSLRWNRGESTLTVTDIAEQVYQVTTQGILNLLPELQPG
ncbi:MAG: hypothetical protein OHK0046_28050 [Anaerolineae bacterium]